MSLTLHRLQQWQDRQLKELLDEEETILMKINYSYQSKPVDEDKTKLFTR